MQSPIRINPTSVLCLVICLIAAGCSSPTPTITLAATSSPRPTATLTSTPTITPTVYDDPFRMKGDPPSLYTMVPTLTPTQKLIRTSTPRTTGRLNVISNTSSTAIPRSSEALTADNVQQWVNIARWDRGVIRSLAFSPDGMTLAVGSFYGVAVYDMYAPGAAPRWIAFDEYFFYNHIYFSEDGKILGLEGNAANQWLEKPVRFIDLQTGKILTGDPGVKLVFTPTKDELEPNYASASSTAKNLEYQGGAKYIKGDRVPKAFGKVINISTNEVIYEINDAPAYITYDQLSHPEGCDLKFFNPCGNAWDPHQPVPQSAEFSSTGRTLAVRFYPTDLFEGEPYGTLRIYRSQDGEMLANLGDTNQPVNDFVYQPGTDHVLVALLNGAIQLWDPENDKMLFQAWNFGEELYGFDLSHDGQFAVMAHYKSIDVRRTSDGAMLGRFAVSAYEFSPVNNWLALGTEDGGIQVIDLETSLTVSRMDGHKAVIYELAFSPDGQELLSSSEDCSVRAWNVRTGQFLNFYEEVSNTPYEGEWSKSRIFVYSLRVMANRQVFGFGSWGTAASWNLDSGATQYVVDSEALKYYQGMITIKPHFPESYWIDFSSKRFFINGNAFSLVDGKPAPDYQPPAQLAESCYIGGVVSKDGKTLFSLGFSDLDGAICALDAQTGRLLDLIEVLQPKTGRYISDLILSPDGTRLYVPIENGIVYIYQVQP